MLLTELPGGVAFDITPSRAWPADSQSFAGLHVRLAEYLSGRRGIEPR